MFKINNYKHTLAVAIFQTQLILLFSVIDYAFYARATMILLICLLIYQGVIWQINLGRVRMATLWQKTWYIVWSMLAVGTIFVINIFLQNSINNIGVL